MTELQKARMLERALGKAVASVSDAILAESDRTDIPDVQSIGPGMFTIRASSLANGAWSPEYYSADIQRKKIRDTVSGAATLNQIRTRLEKLLTSEKKTLHPVFETLIRQVLSEFDDETEEK